jgi:anthraniloyl-CoA monooxygenase
MQFRTEAPDPAVLAATYDLVIASDGANSATRAGFAGAFGPQLELRRCKYIWLSTDLVFDAFKFYIMPTPYGVMQVHGYPYDATGSTFIVEMHEDVWTMAGFGELAPASLPPGASDEASIARIGELLGDIIGAHGIEANNSSGISLARCAAAAGGTATWCCSATRRIPPISRSAPGTKLGNGGRAGPGGVPERAAGHRRSSLTLTRPRRRPVVESTQRARSGQPGMVRGTLGQYTHQDPGAVCVQHHHSEPPRHPRQPEVAPIRSSNAAVDAWFAAECKRRGSAR